MKYFIDLACNSLNKYGEELCGDNVEVVKLKDGMIIVLADGLGSGVKANILATLTSKIAVTMLKEGMEIHETVDTIINTLPVCSVRKLAYATFTIIRVYDDGRVYAVEYDNPPFILIKNNKITEIEKADIEIRGKTIKESKFTLKPNDVLTIISDGVVHAGVGAVLNLGWKWENVSKYVEAASTEKCSKNISESLIKACDNLYEGKPGDDSTVVTLMLRNEETIDLFTGPPKDKSRDQWVVSNFLKGKGKKIVCGGTAANIVSRELQEEIHVNTEYYDKEVPPTASIKSIDLVTEGVLTLSKTVERIKESKPFKNKNDAVSQLTKLLIEDCTHLNLWVGTAVNPAHQNPDFPMDLGIKVKVVEELVSIMKDLGKEVELKFL